VPFLGHDDVARGDYKEWIAWDAIRKTASLHYHVTEKFGHGYSGIDNSVSGARMFFDSLGAHRPRKQAGSTRKERSSDRHGFKLTVPSGLDDYTEIEYSVCPSRFTLFIHNGRQATSEGDSWHIADNDASNLVFINETSSHAASRLDLQRHDGRIQIGTLTGLTFDDIGREATRMYLSELFLCLAQKWSRLVDLSISHCRNLVSSSGLLVRTENR